MGYMLERDPAFSQTVRNRLNRESRRMLLARKPLFLRCSDNQSIFNETRSTIMIVGGNAENSNWFSYRDIPQEPVAMAVNTYRVHHDGLYAGAMNPSVAWRDRDSRESVLTQEQERAQ